MFTIEASWEDINPLWAETGQEPTWSTDIALILMGVPRVGDFIELDYIANDEQKKFIKNKTIVVRDITWNPISDKYPLEGAIWLGLAVD